MERKLLPLSLIPWLLLGLFLFDGSAMGHPAADWHKHYWGSSDRLGYAESGNFPPSQDCGTMPDRT